MEGTRRIPAAAYSGDGIEQAHHRQDSVRQPDPGAASPQGGRGRNYRGTEDHPHRRKVTAAVTSEATDVVVQIVAAEL